MDWKSEPLITRNQRSRLLSFVFLISLDTSQLLHYSSFRHSHLLSLSLLKSHIFYSLEYSFTSPLVWQISSPFCSHLTKLTLFYFIFSTNLLSFFLVHNLANLLSLSCVFLFFSPNHLKFMNHCVEESSCSHRRRYKSPPLSPRNEFYSLNFDSRRPTTQHYHGSTSLSLSVYLFSLFWTDFFVLGLEEAWRGRQKAWPETEETEKEEAAKKIRLSFF